MAELTVAEVLKVRPRAIVFAPLARESIHAQAVNGVISIDPRSQALLGRTLLHELLHMKRPLWSETHVRREEAVLWKAATWIEKGQLYRMLGRATFWTGEEEFDDGDIHRDSGGSEPAG